MAENNNGWIEWNGGECPVGPFTPVMVKLRGGLESKVGATTAGNLFGITMDSFQRT